MRFPSILALAALTLVTAPREARATDGHLLHGVGAVNSALGGIGIASNQSLLGSFFTNPAGLAAFDGTNLEMGFELMKPERTVSSSFGPMSGSTTISAAASCRASSQRGPQMARASARKGTGTAHTKRGT